MKHLLFVDDEPKLLDGLKRLLRPMRNEWSMTFALSGEEALTLLAQAPFDVVISDMRMPGMDGAQLLNAVQQRYPHIVRIILSGHSDRAMIYSSISATHQFLAKPCEADHLKATIHHACALRDVLKSDALQGLVAGLSTIPSLPAFFTEIKQALEAETASLKTIGAIIAQDMGMTAKVLQLVNSAYFGLRDNVSTAEQAVNFLGLDTMQALVLTVHVFSQFPTAGAATFHIERLWADSLRTGALARAIAKAERCSALAIEQAYTAGLLHDVGTLVLAMNVSDRYRALLTEASAKGMPVWEAEQLEFGTTHAEVGAYVLGLWRLGDPIVEAVAYHHRPGDCSVKTFSPLTAVHAAQVLQQNPAEQPASGFMAQIDDAYLERVHRTDRIPVWRELAMTIGKETTS